MKAFFEKTKSGSYVGSVLFAILGIMLLINPGMSFDVLCVSVGMIFLIFAVVNIIMNLRSPVPFVFGAFLIGDIVIGVAGIYFISAPALVKGIIPVVLGILMIYHAVTDIRVSVAMKELGGKYKGMMAVGVVTLIIALLVLFDPFSAGDVMIRLIGAAFLYDGISALIVMLSLSHREKENKKAKTVNYREV